MVNDSDAQRNLQALLEFCKENDSGEQSCHRYWNSDRGSCDEISGGWESVGDDGAYGDLYGGGVGDLAYVSKIAWLNEEVSVVTGNR